MRRHPKTSRTLLSLLIGVIGMPPLGHAAQLALAQAPAGTSWREPAPNVIITLDDSGSMGSGASTTSGMYALKKALRELFDASSQTIPDGSIRLAWNAFNKCRAIPSNSNGCANRNDMRVLDDVHRTNFLNWVGPEGVNPPANGTSLTAADNLTTPTQHAYIAAGDYLRLASATDIRSPWAYKPHSQLEPVLSCRRNYSILMTDGGWNWGFSASNPAGIARGGATTAGGQLDGNADGTNLTLPDNVLYDVTSPQTQVYRGRPATNYSVRYANKDEYISTVSDLAFYYWATDLAPTLPNNVAPKARVKVPETITSGTSSLVLQEYWNPKNDPATWQHLTTYTIGFNGAANWRTTGTGYDQYPRWDAGNDNYGGSFAELVTGRRVWPDPVKGTTVLNTSAAEATNNEQARLTEMWHAALNGRGRLVPSGGSSASLLSAFQEIFAEIAKDTSRPTTGFAATGTSIARTATTQFASSYNADGWTGSLKADTVSKAENGDLTTTPAQGWCQPNCTGTHVTTAEKLDARSDPDIANRLILSWRDSATGARGVPFDWFTTEAATTLTTTQRDLLKINSGDTLAENRFNFIRGVRAEEGTTLRQRNSRQGDIVNSAVWYVADPVSNYAFGKYRTFAKDHAKRLPMVYVGGNDGMLHGFSGEDGTEKIAYVPKGVIANLKLLTQDNYQHRYYVDGSPFSGDVNWGDNTNPDWRTLLVGTLGAGGRGYFVLDVTTPGPSATATGSTLSSNFAKANARDLVVMDLTTPGGSSAGDADVGHLMGNPVVEEGNPQRSTQIARMNNGRWALITGNGYNSRNERPVLLIQYLDQDKALKKIVASATTGQANGLSAPQTVDIDGNGTPDVVYAGDLRGNLWKFDLSATNADNWKVSFGGSPLYSAVHRDGTVDTRQPITAPPLVRASERGVAGLMVAFGTGRNLEEADRSNTAVQSIYSVLDSTRYKLTSTKTTVEIDGTEPAGLGSGVTNLVQQSVDNAAKLANSVGRDFWTVSQNDVPYTGPGAKKGWYLNLPERGERVLAQMSFFDDSNLIELMSVVPATGGSTVDEACEPPPSASRTYRTLLNIVNGKRASVQVMDTNGDGEYDADDGNASRMSAGPAEGRVTTKMHQIRSGSDGRTDRLARLPELPLRPNWRQLQ